jgi:hypothetical protein
MTDVTQRLFTELRSKSEETKARAAYELYDNVLSVSRGTDRIEETLCPPMILEMC